ncbi:ADP-dependent glucokinase/phosphofructokinase [Amnibacterium flavum]|uniref:ADP-dependent phosphofructokinase/glucokinase n=1 Tax=Amnibacterium flavum TaxID=2173173 RepID=A0A2V1HTV9_9MICO|nr:ADP-dependent glucokinase/phosphofructokinase [Amnibacterium flavum]PVZ96008.1 hypothetical protein DDQ50_06050 [Amnibacterium flavum]
MGNIVLGLQGTVDYEVVWDSEVIGELADEYGITLAELSTAIPVDSERALVTVLLAFLRDGAGGERFVVSSDLVEQFAARFETAITLGGTSVRAALAMRVLGQPSILHLVSIDDNVRRLLPEDCAYVCSADRDTLDPHLILQYREGETVHFDRTSITSPHPNRVIFANDPPARELVLSPQLGSLLEDADVFLISGFNVVQDVELIEERLGQLREHLSHLPDGAVVMYEDAGFHILSMSALVRDALLPFIDVYSMNEDELQTYLGRSVDLLDVDQVEAALEDARRLIPARVLTIHTKYWSLAAGETAGRYREALLGGITMASARYLHGDVFSAEDYAAIAGQPVNPGGAAFAEAFTARHGSEVVVLPAYRIETASPTTIGLGDTFVGGFIEAFARSRREVSA